MTAHASKREPPALRVLFIAGWGRSGSTVLGNILGEADGAVSVGELNGYWRMRSNRARMCGCGLPHVACPFWSRVVEALRDRRNGEPAHVLPVRQRELGFWPLVAKAVTQPSAQPWASSQYPSILADLYQAVAQVAGATVIVDGSKYPGDALMALAAPGISTYLVQLVRDPRGTAWSWMRPKAIGPGESAVMDFRGPMQSSWKWLTHNLATELFSRFAEAGKYRRLRYEDFAAQPRETTLELARWVGVDSQSLPWMSARSVRLGRNHTALGNPDRFKYGETEILPDNRWRAQMATRFQATSSLLTLPLLLRYGYPVIP